MIKTPHDATDHYHEDSQIKRRMWYNKYITNQKRTHSKDRSQDRSTQL